MSAVRITPSFWFGLALTCLIAVAFFLRFWNIEGTPSGLYPDEAVNAIDAVHAIETGDYRLFYENNYGREGLFINLQALAIRTLGYHVWALKLWSAIFGTLTVWGIYLLAYELWRKRSVAFTAAFLTAFSYWAINFSRIGFRAIMMPFLLSFTFYFLFRALRTKDWRTFLISGLCLGLGLHTYIAFRLVPIIFVFVLIGLAISFEHFFRRHWKSMLVFVAGAFIAAAPMFYDFVQNPDHFISRSSAISIFDPAINHGNLWLTLGETFGLSLIKYNFWGDQNWRHNYPPYPSLDPLAGTLFLAGFLFVISRTVRLLIRRIRTGERERELAINIFLLGWFFSMLSPEFLTNEGLPHSLRSIGTLPVVFLIASIPMLWVGEWYRIATPSARLVLGTSLVAFFVIIASWNTIKYFVFFAANPEQHSAFNQNYTNMATYLKALPPDVHKYVYADAGGTSIDNGLPVTAESTFFLTYHQVDNLEFILPGADFTPVSPAVIIPMNSLDRGFINSIRARYPAERTETIDLYPGTKSDFIILRLP